MMNGRGGSGTAATGAATVADLRRRRRAPVVGAIAFSITAVVVVATGIALSGPLSPAPPSSGFAAVPSPSANASVAPTPRPSPGWVPSGPLPACAPPDSASPAPPSTQVAQVTREVNTQGSRVGRPAGISYSPEAELLMLFPAALPEPAPIATATIGLMTLFGDPGGSSDLGIRIPDPAIASFDGVGDRLVAFDAASRELLSIPMTPTGVVDSESGPVSRFDLRPLNLGTLGGSTVSQATGSLYLLDTGRDRLVRIGADTNPDGTTAPALRDGGVCVITLTALNGSEVRGLAADPVTGHLFVMGLEPRRLFELDEAGRLLVIHDLSPLGIGDLRAMVFAPSGDPTEAERLTSLYLLDHFDRVEGRPARDRIVELRLKEPVVAVGPAPASDVHAVLVQTTQTYRWSPPSSDPSGLAYVPDVGVLLSDAEVDETPGFDGANLFEALPTGELIGSSLTGFSPEPSGLAVDPDTGRRFVSDDVARRIFVLDPGRDALSGTQDDVVSSIDTTLFGSYDPEGLAYGEGSLFVADGLGAEIYRFKPGPNGVFDGVAPAGDDEISRFDTRSLGQPTPEGLEYAPDRKSLLVVSNDRRANLLEVSADGRPIRVIDLSFLNALAPAGLAYGPGSALGGPPSVFIADRGIDNARNPAENDGRMYEIRIVRGGPPNLIANPGMELDDDGDGAIDGWDNQPGVSPSTDAARSGQTSMRLEAPAQGLVVDQRLPSIDAGRAYTFAIWLNVPPSEAPFTVRVRLRWRDANGTTIGSQRIAVLERSTAGWDKLVANLRSPPRTTNAAVTLSLAGEGSVVYVDDVLLIPLG
jgi:hypothetical protein